MSETLPIFPRSRTRNAAAHPQFGLNLLARNRKESATDLLQAKDALVAIDPKILTGRSFEHFCEVIRVFQEKGLFFRTSIASVIQPSQFSMPSSFYREHREGLARKARGDVSKACRGRFQFMTTRALQSESDANEEIVELLTKRGRRSGADILVVGSNDRSGIPYWLLGSISETSVLTAKMPVLVIKHATPARAFSRSTNFTIGVDVASPPSPQEIKWLTRLAKTAHARIHLVYIVPRKNTLVDRLQQRKGLAEAHKILGQIERAFENKGVAATSSVRTAGRTVAHALVDFAEKKNTLILIATTPKRSRARKLLLGSTARLTLALTKRPFLSLRID